MLFHHNFNKILAGSTCLPAKTPKELQTRASQKVASKTASNRRFWRVICHHLYGPNFWAYKTPNFLDSAWSSRRNIALSFRHALCSPFLLSFDWGVSQYSSIQGTLIPLIVLTKTGLIFVRKLIQPVYNQKGHYLPIFKNIHFISTLRSII